MFSLILSGIIILVIVGICIYSAFMYILNGYRKKKCKYGNIKAGSSIKVYKNDRI